MQINARVGAPGRVNWGAGTQSFGTAENWPHTKENECNNSSHQKSSRLDERDSYFAIFKT